MRRAGRRWKQAHQLLEPQINAEGLHVWPFPEPSFLIDVTFQVMDSHHQIRLNRHNFLELVYVCSGWGKLWIQDRVLPIRQGDLLVIGSTLYHRIENRSRAGLAYAALYFHPDLLRADPGSDGVEYLTPFLCQGNDFPHVVRSKTGIPPQAFNLIQQISTELPPADGISRLSVKTCLKMAMVPLVKHFSTYAGTAETFQRQQRALERLQPLFRRLEERVWEPIQVRDAARICAMSESHFMAFFKAATGQPFMTYLNHCRAERAQALLTTTDRTISEISQDLGFCDQSYFGTVFRRLVGITPATCRRRFRHAVGPVPK